MIVDVFTRVWRSADQLGPTLAPRARRRAAAMGTRMSLGVADLLQAAHDADRLIVHGLRSQKLQAHIPAAQIAAIVKQGQGKILGFAGVDPTEPNFICRYDDARRLGLHGVTLSPAGQGFHPAHTNAMQLYERCEEHRLPIYFESLITAGPDALMPFAQPALLDEVARTFPRLRIVIGQAGRPWIDEALALAAKHENVFVDLADIAQDPWLLYDTLTRAARWQAMDRLLLASAFPWLNTRDAIAAVLSVNRITKPFAGPALAREALGAIVERDALALLGLPIDAAPTRTAKPEADHVPELIIQRPPTEKPDAAPAAPAASDADEHHPHTHDAPDNPRNHDEPNPDANARDAHDQHDDGNEHDSQPNPGDPDDQPEADHQPMPSPSPSPNPARDAEAHTTADQRGKPDDADQADHDPPARIDAARDSTTASDDPTTPETPEVDQPPASTTPAAQTSPTKAVTRKAADPPTAPPAPSIPSKPARAERDPSSNGATT